MNEVTQRSHAIVIGGSIAGLLAARVLADHFDHVTIIERDRLPTGPQPRKGVPQASHVHMLLEQGRRVLESFYPGISAELQADGAVHVDWGKDTRIFTFVGWQGHFEDGPRTINCSRDLLEHHIRRRTLARPNVSTLQGCDVIGLLHDAKRNGITGVQIHTRDERLGDGILSADLVVDASGRTSRAPEWLQAVGYPTPQETTVNSFLGYSSRLYQPPADFKANWKVLLVRQRTPTNSRGAGIYSIENGLWQVNLGASGREYPPTDNDGFLEFLRSLPDQSVYKAVKQVQPVSAINGYRRTENRWRHYEKLRRFPNSFVVLGDAACAFNPVYGQGMSIAALAAQALSEDLHKAKSQVRSGFDLRFQRRLARILRNPWLMATGEDFRTAATVGGKPSSFARLSHRYFDRLIELATRDASINRRFSQVLHLLQPPMSLFSPRLVIKVLASFVKRKAHKTATRPRDEARPARTASAPRLQVNEDC